METLPISVVVIARNASSTIGEALASIQKNQPAEIIVVDGCSTDETMQIARRFTDRVYSDEGRDKAYARQHGAEKATQEYIAYVDADVTLEEGSLATMLDELRRSDCVSMSARQILAPECSNYWGWASTQHTGYSQRRSGGESLSTMACLLRRETILKYGFDPDAGARDDVIVETKLKQQGYKLGVSSASVYHHHKMDFNSFVKYRFFLGELAPGYLREYGWRRAEFWPPVVMVYWLGFCLIKGKFKLIPYFVVNGVAQTAGMARGLFPSAKD